MARVSIRYQNGTTVEANNLGDALFHIAHTGGDYVSDIVEQDSLARVECEACRGAGVVEQDPGRSSRGEVDEKVAAINERAPRLPAGDNIEERVKAARSVAKA
jgi:hypothetical protein